MPVPLNAFTEVIRCWFTKRLGYLVDDSIPVRFYKGRVPSDIDMICIHPQKKKIKINFPINISLRRKVLVESKGWFDVDPGYVTDYLLDDLKMMGGMGRKVIPKRYTKKKEGFTFGILKEEIFEKGKKLFGDRNFDRVIVVPHLKDKRKAGKLITRREMIERFKKKHVIIIEMSGILNDLFKYIREEDARDNLRKNFVLEFIHLIAKFVKIAYPMDTLVLNRSVEIYKQKI